MEWYFGSYDDDLVVPNDQELLDRLPSPDSWSQWGITPMGSSDSPQKHFNGKRFCDDVDISISSYERECSSNSNMCHVLHNGSLQWTTLSHEQPDYQLNNLATVDQMDDIFLSSLLEADLTSTDNLYESSSFSPKSPYSMMSADNLSADMIIESQYIPSHTHSTGSSKYLKTHAFSPPVEWENGETTSCPLVKAPVVKVSISSEQDSGSRYVGEETSLEESVLQELERVTAKLTGKTRACFRDALYRLAENSKQQTVMNPGRSGDLLLEKHPLVIVHDETLRLEKTEATESKTNVIDRAIANLMFDKMDLSAWDHPAAASLKFKEEAAETTEQFKHNLSRPWISCCP